MLMRCMAYWCSQIGQGTADEVEFRNLRAELEGKEAKYALEKGQIKNSAQGMSSSNRYDYSFGHRLTLLRCAS